MTQERLRELLRERVADVTVPDLSGRAWQAARVVRRRRRLGAVAGVVVATVGVSTAIAAVDSTSPPRRPGEPATSDVTTPAPTPDATYQGIAVWWSPDQHEEQVLAGVASPLPPEIDLTDTLPLEDGSLDRAVAAFVRARTLVLVPEGGGALRSVDLSGLQDVTKPNGYRYFPAHDQMLSPDGRRLVFPQDGHLAVLTVATGEWSEVDTGDATTLYPVWLDGESVALRPGPQADLGPVVDVTTGRTEPQAGGVVAATPFASMQGSVPYGAPASSPGGALAQAWSMGVDLPVRDPGTDYSKPEFVAVFDRTPSVLAITARVDGEDSRFKDCCRVAGWLDDRTVVYESRQTDSVLVAWQLGSSRFGLVSRVQGQYLVASYALSAG